MADVCPRCHGRGWRWTGAAWLPCRARLCGAPAGPAPVPAASTAVRIIPAAEWPAVVAQLLLGSRPGPARASTAAVTDGDRVTPRSGSEAARRAPVLAVAATIPLRASEPTRSLR